MAFGRNRRERHMVELAQLADQRIARGVARHGRLAAFLALQAALFADHALKAALGHSEVVGQRAGFEAEALGMAQRRGELGQAGLVIVAAEDQLDYRGQRRAVLDGQTRIGDQFGKFIGLLRGGKSEVIGPADRSIKRLAGAVFRPARGLGQFARRGEPIGQAKGLGIRANCTSRFACNFKRSEIERGTAGEFSLTKAGFGQGAVQLDRRAKVGEIEHIFVIIAKLGIEIEDVVFRPVHFGFDFEVEHIVFLVDHRVAQSARN